MDELKDRTVGEIAMLYPESLKIFEEYRIDLCCGGRLSLAEVARKHGLDLERLLAALEKVVPTPP
jgi:regulator of cell morphogenesis and NO signaling